MKITGTSEKILASAVDFLKEWEVGDATLDSVLDELRENDLVEKAAVASLLFEYFRHKGLVDSLIEKNAKKGKVNLHMRTVLSCAITQIFYQTGIAPQSAVNVAVDYAKQLKGAGAGGFVNAVLRTVLRDTAALKQKDRTTFPPILEERWTREFGAEKTAEMIRCFAMNPPVTFRNRNASETELLAVEAEKMDAFDFAGDFQFYQGKAPQKLFQSNLLQQAKIYVQDPATSLAFSLLEDAPHGRALDACAAPGGKTIMLADRSDPAKLMITAADRSNPRLAQMNINLKRAGIHARSVQAEAQQMPFSPESFDFILADVPCSNSGVIRRRPDAPWRFTEKRLADVVQLQKEILDSLAKLVKKEGLLLYSTCSVESEEDHGQIQEFLTRNPEFSLVRDRLLLPCALHDGAYAALLRKAGA